jgi:hypothetical protein
VRRFTQRSVLGPYINMLRSLAVRSRRYPTTTFHGVAAELEYGIRVHRTMVIFTRRPQVLHPAMPFDGDRYVMSPDAASPF